MCGCKSHLVLSNYTLKIILFTFNETNMKLVNDIMRVITFINNNCFIFSIEYRASSILNLNVAMLNQFI